MNTFRLKIITPEKIFYDGEAVQIISKTQEGNIGIMSGHVPYVANLVPSALKIKEKDGGEYRVAAVAGGFVKVSNSETVVVTSAVEWSEDIDVVRALSAKEKAENAIKMHESDKEFERAEQKLKRALNRLTVSGKY
ncbi:MAG: ATP synthase F1 subunit epsilon [Oscillospiraceae bacterium]